MNNLGEEFLPEEWGYREGDVPLGCFMSPDWPTASMCLAQGLRIVSCEGIGLGGLAKENNEGSLLPLREGE